jgi:molecular chaperone DnaK
MTAIGIDLGTSNTVVAHFKDGQPHTLVDQAGRRLIPSIISFHPSGTVLVGDSAKMRRFNDSSSTVTGAKRLMGRLWGSPELEAMQKRVPFPLREGKNRTVRALLRGELYSIPELSAFVVRKAKAWAEEALHQQVTQAVITVPANFNELQRQATKLSGELAGLEVLRVLNEPTAAALAYGHIAPATKDEQIAVYDFGGGTFDLTMLKMSERELRVRATAGDMFLGGDDIDLAIANRMAEAYLQQHRYDPRADMEVFARVRIAAERLKVDLSSAEEATVPLNELMYGPGGKPIQWSYSMTRKELDAILDPFVNQSLKVCEDAMELLQASPRDFDRVVLVGGTTLSPRIRQRVTEFFGREPVEGLDPEEAVALGAAISSTMPVARKVKAAAQATGKGPPPPRPPPRPPGPAEPTYEPDLDAEAEAEPTAYPISLRPPVFQEESEEVVQLPVRARASQGRRTAAIALAAVGVLALAAIVAASLKLLGSGPPADAPTPKPAGRGMPTAVPTPPASATPAPSAAIQPTGSSAPAATPTAGPESSAAPPGSAGPAVAPAASTATPAPSAAAAAPSGASAAPSLPPK